MTASDAASAGPARDRAVSRAMAWSPVASLVAIAAVPVGLALAAVAQWCWLLVANAGRGLDVSDEAYYLSSITDPAETTATNTDFGFYWHRVLWLVGGRLTSLRIAGLVVLLASCARVYPEFGVAVPAEQVMVTGSDAVVTAWALGDVAVAIDGATVTVDGQTPAIDPAPPGRLVLRHWLLRDPSR